MVLKSLIAINILAAASIFSTKDFSDKPNKNTRSVM